jgi:hypothetical protein
MSDILSDKSLGRHMQPRKRRRALPARAGVTPRNFWADRPQKSGVAPARFDLFCAVTFARAVAANLLERIPYAKGRVKKLAILKVQKVILTVFTLVTFFLPLFHLESGSARGQTSTEISSWVGATATVSVATKWGRSSPTRCFARVQIDRRTVWNLFSVRHLVHYPGDCEGDG